MSSIQAVGLCMQFAMVNAPSNRLKSLLHLMIVLTEQVTSVIAISTFYKHASLQLCSAENWRFAAKHFIKKHPEDVVVHCELNSNGK